jgi:hypothetical protein
LAGLRVGAGRSAGVNGRRFAEGLPLHAEFEDCTQLDSAQKFLLEAKWRDEKAAATDLDTFAAKIRRKLDNTLGLFLSMNGQETAVSLHSQNRPVMILMNGADLNAVIEGRM